MLLLTLFGCGLLSFQNNPPRLLAVNGVPNARLFGLPTGRPELQATPGEDLPIRLEFEDPERRPVRVWWPNAPEGWAFDPDAAEGVWHVPEDPLRYARWGFTVVLEDTDPGDPRAAEFYVPIWFEASGDSGDSGGYGFAARGR